MISAKLIISKIKKIQKYAKSIGLNLKQFNQDIKDDNIKTKIREDQNIFRLNPVISGDVSFMFNGLYVSNPRIFTLIINKEYNLTKEYAARGVSNADMYKTIATEIPRTKEQARIAAKNRLTQSIPDAFNAMDEQIMLLTSYDNDDIKKRLFSDLKLPKAMEIPPYLNETISPYIPEQCNIDDKLMSDAIRKAKEKADKCYQLGVLNMTIKIAPDDTASVTTESGSLKDSEAESCIVNAFSSYSYPTFTCLESANSETGKTSYNIDIKRTYYYKLSNNFEFYTKEFYDKFNQLKAGDELYNYEMEIMLNSDGKKFKPNEFLRETIAKHPEILNRN